MKPCTTFAPGYGNPFDYQKKQQDMLRKSGRSYRVYVAGKISVRARQILGMIAKYPGITVCELNDRTGSSGVHNYLSCLEIDELITVTTSQKTANTTTKHLWITEKGEAV